MMENIEKPELKSPEVNEETNVREVATHTQEGLVQDFNQLKRACLANQTLFEDPEFLAQDSSVYFSKSPDNPIEWKRPIEIVSDPKFFVNGFSRFDLNQGDLQDCWFVAAAANLAMHPNLFSQVVPEDQSFQVNYAGIFHFRFWQYGKWIDVVIDDRLPTSHGKLIFLSSPESTEFWGALLEKAYAKLHGSYESLVDGTPCESMEDFTGGVTEMHYMNAISPNLFSILLNAQARNSLMGCIVEKGSNAKESKTPEGLIRWHSYSITRVKYMPRKIHDTDEQILLLRLRNPWGRYEWNGQWSDDSPAWRDFSDSERAEFDLKSDADGEFWMTFHDFKHHFGTLDICNLTPDSLSDSKIGSIKWELNTFDGKWVRGVTSGGCRDFAETFWRNPQYRLMLEHPDEGDDKCSVIVALMQKNRRALKSKGFFKLHIGFAVYKLHDKNALPKPLDKKYFEKHRDSFVVDSGKFLDNREVSCRLKLLPGVYCIIPSTFEPHEEGEYFLRVFSDKANTNFRAKTKQADIGEVSEAPAIVIANQENLPTLSRLYEGETQGDTVSNTTCHDASGMCLLSSEYQGVLEFVDQIKSAPSESHL